MSCPRSSLESRDGYLGSHGLGDGVMGSIIVIISPVSPCGQAGSALGALHRDVWTASPTAPRASLPSLRFQIPGPCLRGVLPVWGTVCCLVTLAFCHLFPIPLWPCHALCSGTASSILSRVSTSRVVPPLIGIYCAAPRRPVGHFFAVALAARRHRMGHVFPVLGDATAAAIHPSASSSWLWRRRQRLKHAEQGRTHDIINCSRCPLARPGSIVALT